MLNVEMGRMMPLAMRRTSLLLTVSHYNERKKSLGERVYWRTSGPQWVYRPIMRGWVSRGVE